MVSLFSNEYIVVFFIRSIACSCRLSIPKLPIFQRYVVLSHSSLKKLPRLQLSFYVVSKLVISFFLNNKKINFKPSEPSGKSFCTETKSILKKNQVWLSLKRGYKTPIKEICASTNSVFQG